jgi:hypothetical protein
VSEAGLNTEQKVLAFSAVVEIATGLALMIHPVMVVPLLLGANESDATALLGRVAGIALLALGLACLPSRRYADTGSPASRAMLSYNALIALYLAYLGAVGHVGGPLLWPAVALHAGVALLLGWKWGR